MSVADAQKAIEAAKSKLVPQDRLQQANEDLNEARRKTNTLKTKWEKLRDETLRAGKDPNDQIKSPKTTSAKKEYDEARAEEGERSNEYTDLTTQNNKAREDLRVAEAALADAKAQPQRGGDAEGQSAPSSQPTQQQQSARDQGVFAGVAVWLPTLLSLICLGVLVFLYLRLRALEDTILQHLHKLVRGSDENQAGKLQKLSADVSVLNEGPNSLASLMREVIGLRDLIYKDGQERLKQKKLEAAREANNANRYEGAQREASTPAYEEPVDFPISAESFLSRISGQRQVPITLDPLKGILVRDQEGLGLLMLVRDGSVYDGQLCMVPGMTRLNTAQEFHYNYEQFYDCGRPSAGEVWISKPALVDKVDGGWKLLAKGQLEVRN